MFSKILSKAIRFFKKTPTWSGIYFSDIAASVGGHTILDQVKELFYSFDLPASARCAMHIVLYRKSSNNKARLPEFEYCVVASLQDYAFSDQTNIEKRLFQIWTEQEFTSEKTFEQAPRQFFTNSDTPLYYARAQNSADGHLLELCEDTSDVLFQIFSFSLKPFDPFDKTSENAAELVKTVVYTTSAVNRTPANTLEDVLMQAALMPGTQVAVSHHNFLKYFSTLREFHSRKSHRQYACYKSALGGHAAIVEQPDCTAAPITLMVNQNEVVRDAYLMQALAQRQGVKLVLTTDTQNAQANIQDLALGIARLTVEDGYAQFDYAVAAFTAILQKELSPDQKKVLLQAIECALDESDQAPNLDTFLYYIEHIDMAQKSGLSSLLRMQKANRFVNAFNLAEPFFEQIPAESTFRISVFPEQASLVNVFLSYLTNLPVTKFENISRCLVVENDVMTMVNVQIFERFARVSRRIGLSSIICLTPGEHTTYAILEQNWGQLLLIDAALLQQRSFAGVQAFYQHVGAYEEEIVSISKKIRPCDLVYFKSNPFISECGIGALSLLP